MPLTMIFVDGIFRASVVEYVITHRQVLAENGLLIIHDFFNTRMSVRRLEPSISDNTIHPVYKVFNAWKPDRLFHNFDIVARINTTRIPHNDMIILRHRWARTKPRYAYRPSLHFKRAEGVVPIK